MALIFSRFADTPGGGTMGVEEQVSVAVSWPHLRVIAHILNEAVAVLEAELGPNRDAGQFWIGRPSGRGLRRMCARSPRGSGAAETEAQLGAKTARNRRSHCCGLHFALSPTASMLQAADRGIGLDT
jgi:hypothetical protein